ncbi:hypothetical protein [Actinoplanes sp. NPDC023714]
MIFITAEFLIKPAATPRIVSQSIDQADWSEPGEMAVRPGGSEKG